MSLHEDYILSVEQPQKPQCRASSVGTAQPSVELTPTTPRKDRPNRLKRSVATPLSKTGLVDDVQRDALPIGCTPEVHLETVVSMDWVCIASRNMEYSVLRVVIYHLSVSALSHPTVIPARHRAYEILLTKDVKMLRCIGRYRASLGSVWVIFRQLSNSFVAKRAIACSSSAAGMSIFSAKKA